MLGPRKDFFGSDGVGFLHDFFDGNGDTVLVARSLSCLDEGHDFERFLARHRCRAACKEFRDFYNERLVAFVLCVVFEKVGAEDGQSVPLCSGSDTSEDADASIVPQTYDYVGTF